MLRSLILITLLFVTGSRCAPETPSDATDAYALPHLVHLPPAAVDLLGVIPHRAGGDNGALQAALKGSQATIIDLVGNFSVLSSLFMDNKEEEGEELTHPEPTLENSLRGTCGALGDPPHLLIEIEALRLLESVAAAQLGPRYLQLIHGVLLPPSGSAINTIPTLLRYDATGTCTGVLDELERWFVTAPSAPGSERVAFSAGSGRFFTTLPADFAPLQRVMGNATALLKALVEATVEGTSPSPVQWRSATYCFVTAFSYALWMTSVVPVVQLAEAVVTIVADDGVSSGAIPWDAIRDFASSFGSRVDQEVGAFLDSLSEVALWQLGTFSSVSSSSQIAHCYHDYLRDLHVAFSSLAAEARADPGVIRIEQSIASCDWLTSQSGKLVFYFDFDAPSTYLEEEHFLNANVTLVRQEAEVGERAVTWVDHLQHPREDFFPADDFDASAVLWNSVSTNGGNVVPLPHASSAPLVPRNPSLTELSCEPGWFLSVNESTPHFGQFFCESCRLWASTVLPSYCPGNGIRYLCAAVPSGPPGGDSVRYLLPDEVSPEYFPDESVLAVPTCPFSCNDPALYRTEDGRCAEIPVGWRPARNGTFNVERCPNSVSQGMTDSPLLRGGAALFDGSQRGSRGGNCGFHLRFNRHVRGDEVLRPLTFCNETSGRLQRGSFWIKFTMPVVAEELFHQLPAAPPLLATGDTRGTSETATATRTQSLDQERVDEFIAGGGGGGGVAFHVATLDNFWGVFVVARRGVELRDGVETDVVLLRLLFNITFGAPRISDVLASIDASQREAEVITAAIGIDLLQHEISFHARGHAIGSSQSLPFRAIDYCSPERGVNKNLFFALGDALGWPGRDELWPFGIAAEFPTRLSSRGGEAQGVANHSIAAKLEVRFSSVTEAASHAEWRVRALASELATPLPTVEMLAPHAVYVSNGTRRGEAAEDVASRLCAGFHVPSAPPPENSADNVTTEVPTPPLDGQTEYNTSSTTAQPFGSPPPSSPDMTDPPTSVNRSQEGSSSLDTAALVLGHPATLVVTLVLFLLVSSLLASRCWYDKTKARKKQRHGVERESGGKGAKHRHASSQRRHSRAHRQNFSVDSLQMDERCRSTGRDASPSPSDVPTPPQHQRQQQRQCEDWTYESPPCHAPRSRGGAAPHSSTNRDRDCGPLGRAPTPQPCTPMEYALSPAEAAARERERSSRNLARRSVSPADREGFHAPSRDGAAHTGGHKRRVSGAAAAREPFVSADSSNNGHGPARAPVGVPCREDYQSSSRSSHSSDSGVPSDHGSLVDPFAAVVTIPSSPPSTTRSAHAPWAAHEPHHQHRSHSSSPGSAPLRRPAQSRTEGCTFQPQAIDSDVD